MNRACLHVNSRMLYYINFSILSIAFENYGAFFKKLEKSFSKIREEVRKEGRI